MMTQGLLLFRGVMLSLYGWLLLRLLKVLMLFVMVMMLLSGALLD
jgi:hypothetical protein